MSESNRPTGPTESTAQSHHYHLAEPVVGDSHDGGTAAKSRGRKPSSSSSRWFGGLKRETRFGAAAFLSFSLLVGVLIVNKWRIAPKEGSSGKSLPLMALGGGAANGATQIEIAPADPTNAEGEATPPPPPSEGLSPVDTKVHVAEDSSSQNPPPPSNDMPLPNPTPANEGTAPPLPTVADSGTPALPSPTQQPEPAQPPPPIQEEPATTKVADAAPVLREETPTPLTPAPLIEEPKPIPVAVVETPKPLPVPIPVVEARKTPTPAFTLPPISPTPETSVSTVSAPDRTGNGDLIILPNIGTTGMVESTPPGDTVKSATSRAPIFEDEASADFAAAPLPKATVKEDPPAEVTLHRVERGENFWTISKYYYNSGRYYKALYAANRDKATAIDKLYVGTTIRVPPPEQLNVSLIEAVSPPTVAPASKRLTTKTGNRTEVELALPVDEAPEQAPLGSTRAREAPATLRDPDEPPARSDLPIYKVKTHDTFRSIARDTLGNSRRHDEILELNRDVIDDSDRPTPGQILRLPTDARVSPRRGRP